MHGRGVSKIGCGHFSASFHPSGLAFSSRWTKRPGNGVRARSTSYGVSGYGPPKMKRCRVNVVRFLHSGLDTPCNYCNYYYGVRRLLLLLLCYVPHGLPTPPGSLPLFSSPGGQTQPTSPCRPVLIAIVRYREEPVSPRKKAI